MLILLPCLHPDQSFAPNYSFSYWSHNYYSVPDCWISHIAPRSPQPHMVSVRGLLRDHLPLKGLLSQKVSNSVSSYWRSLATFLIAPNKLWNPVTSYSDPCHLSFPPHYYVCSVDSHITTVCYSHGFFSKPILRPETICLCLCTLYSYVLWFTASEKSDQVSNSSLPFASNRCFFKFSFNFCCQCWQHVASCPKFAQTPLALEWDTLKHSLGLKFAGF